jgi:hypothetical protein
MQKKRVYAFSIETMVTGAPRPPRRPKDWSQLIAVVSLLTTLVSIAVTVLAPMFTS